MLRRFLSIGTVLIFVLVLALFAVAGCGGEDKSSSDGSSDGSSAATADLSADQIVTQSEAKMAAVKSAAFTADVKLTIQGDASKMSDPTSAALLSSGMSLHAEGASASDPLATDIKIGVGIMGQNLDFGLLAQGDKAWVEYQGKWYVTDKKSGQTLSEQADKGASPTEQLKSFGLDPATWGTTYELVGTEDLSGTQVYHVKATADPQKLVDALLKAANDPALAEKLGAQGQELEQSLPQTEADTAQIKKALKTVSVDYWIGVDDMLMYKAEAAVVLDTKGMKDAEGVDGMSLSASATMSAFDEPVTVDPPKTALPIEKLSNEMFGSMMGGSSL